MRRGHIDRGVIQRGMAGFFFAALIALTTLAALAAFTVLACACASKRDAVRGVDTAAVLSDASRGGGRTALPIGSSCIDGGCDGLPRVDPDRGRTSRGQACGGPIYLGWGPFPSALEACRAGLADSDCEARRTVAEAAAQKPYLSIEVIAAPDFSEKATHYGLLLQLEAGWFLVDLGTEGIVKEEEFGYDGYPPSSFDSRESYELPTIQVTDVLPGGSPEIVLCYANPSGPFRDKIPEGRQLHVCGLGASGKPACAGYLFLTTESRKPVADVKELFGPHGEVLSLEIDELVECLLVLDVF